MHQPPPASLSTSHVVILGLAAALALAACQDLRRDMGRDGGPRDLGREPGAEPKGGETPAPAQDAGEAPADAAGPEPDAPPVPGDGGAGGPDGPESSTEPTPQAVPLGIWDEATWDHSEWAP